MVRRPNAANSSRFRLSYSRTIFFLFLFFFLTRWNTARKKIQFPRVKRSSSDREAYARVNVIAATRVRVEIMMERRGGGRNSAEWWKITSRGQNSKDRVGDILIIIKRKSWEQANIDVGQRNSCNIENWPTFGATFLGWEPRVGWVLWARAVRVAEVIASPLTSGISKASVDHRRSLLGLASWDCERNRRNRHHAAVASSVELPIVMRRARLGESLRRGWSSRLVQSVRALVLLAHPINDEHDDQYRAEEAYHGAADHSWKQEIFYIG